MKLHLHIIKFILINMLCILSAKNLQGSHLVGGTMYYECLGNNTYKITLIVYRDCNSTTFFDDQASIASFDENGNIYNVYSSSFTSSVVVPIVLNNPCLVSPPNVCIEKAEYELIIDLPPNAGGYDVVYQRCCRNSNAINITDPGGSGSTYKVHIPGTNDATCNNSPVFNNPPPTIMCTGYEFNYDLSATDPDGDSLYYSFSTPINGGSSNDPAPNPPSPPPYNTINWSGGYATSYQIDANPQFSIDPATGQLSGWPTNAGFYTFCIAIKEYRNGIFINEIYRDFLVITTTCESNTIVNFPPQTEFCAGLTVDFLNTSINSPNYFWDFGDPTTIADTSLLATPSYTYPDTGTYHVMLVANPGYFCADTIFHEYNVYPEINPSFLSQQDQCLPNNNYTFNALGTYDTDAIITWDFGGAAAPASASTESVQMSFTDEGIHTVNLTIQDNGCTAYYNDVITVYGYPIANFPEQSIFCNGTTVQLENNSLNANGYFWDFGDIAISSDTSNTNTTSYTYNNEGEYIITLIANQHDLCFDTISHVYNMFSTLSGSFNSSESQCLSDNLFTLHATGNFDANAVINWDFGSAATPPSLSGDTVVQVSFLAEGFHVVHLNIEEYGCSLSYTDTLRVYPNISPTYSLAPQEGCQPFLVDFMDTNSVWTPIYYWWNFGDGDTSTEPSPTHTYQDTGLFDVSLTLYTDTGCVDTASVVMPELIRVNPKPISMFKVTPYETFFLNHEITATDLSMAYQQEFNFGDGSTFTDQLITYSYLDTGHYQVSQLVTNEHGCMDTTFQTVWVKPDFLFFVPNSFTPNKDGINDVFLPQIYGIMEYELEIYNRWGELLFHSNQLDMGWDGSFKDTACPSGVYLWKIKAKTIDHIIHTEIGNINVMR